MRHKDLRVWGKLGKNCRFSFTSKMKESLYPPAENLLIPLPLGKVSAPVESPPPPLKFYPFPLHNNFNVLTQAVIIAVVPFLF